MTENPKKAPTNMDEYIANFPEDIQSRLEAMRKTIHEAAPQAEETLSYGMPAFRQKLILVYFSVSKHHIGFYPTSEPIVVFQDRLTGYKSSKGAIQFPYDQPIPFDLVTEIVKYRVEQVAKKK